MARRNTSQAKPPRRRRLTPAERRAAMPPRLRQLTDAGGAVAFGGVSGFIAHGPAALSWPLTFTVGVAAAAAFVLWRTVPRFVYTGVVLLLWVLLIPLVTWLFAAVVPEFGLDIQGRVAALALYALFIAGLAHRTSRGRPWLTVALALFAVTVVAAISYRFQWRAGLWFAYAAGLLVIGLRAGFGPWIRDTLDQFGEWRQGKSNRRVDLARWKDVRGAELATAATLTRVSADHRVVHDRTIPGSVDDAWTIDHIVIGPGGATVLASIKLGDGQVTRRSDGSIWHQRRGLDKQLREAWWQARVVQTRTEIPTHAILVIQGPAQVAAPLIVGLYDHQGDQEEVFTGSVTLLHGSQSDGQQLLEAVSEGTGERYNKRQVGRYARRIGKAFPAGQLARPSGWEERAAAAALWPGDAVAYAPQNDLETDDATMDLDAPQTAAEPLTDPTPVIEPAAEDPAAPIEAALPPPATKPEIPVSAPEPAAVEHREYDWDGGEEADAIATEGLELIAQCDLSPGDRVNALRPDGMLIGWVVIGEPYIHAEGMAVIDIADQGDYAAAQKRGTTPDQYLAEPLDHLMAVEQK